MSVFVSMFWYTPTGCRGHSKNEKVDTLGSGGSAGLNGEAGSSAQAGAGGAKEPAGFSVQDGYVTACGWQGHAFTSQGPSTAGLNGTTSSINVDDFSRAPICASGLVSAREDYGAWAILGYNIAEQPGAAAREVVPTGDGVYVRLRNTGGSELRVQIQDAIGSAGGQDSGEHRWCAGLQLEEQFIPWGEFNTQCWSPDSGTGYAREPIQSVMILVPGPNVRDTEFEYCLQDLSEVGSLCPLDMSDDFPDAARVAISLAERHQTLEGLGASMAWTTGALVNHPQRAEIYQQVFGDLGLDILRLRNRFERASEPVDLNEELQLLEAATESLGQRPRVLLTSWSPPAGLKANGDENCYGNADCTLARDNGQFMYDAFADYWRASLLAYSDLGIDVDYVSIQNEPAFIPDGWSGCRFEPSETDDYPGYDHALALTKEQLSTLATPPKLLGAENLGVHYGTEASFQAALTQNLLDGVAHHLYELGNDGVWDWRAPGPDSFIVPMRDVANAAGDLPIFMTEFQTADGGSDLEGGFETAWLIHNSFVEEQVSAWLYFGLVWSTKGGLIVLQGDDHAVRDQYYSVAHYARFTDPGYVRVGASSTSVGVRASAFLAPDARRLTAVLLNVGEHPVQVEIDGDAFPAASVQGFLTVYRPGNSERWTPMDLALEPKLVLPARSIVSVVWDQ